MSVIVAGRGVRIEVGEVGAGRPVLMIPSLGRGAADYHNVAAALAAQGWRCFLPSPRGMGQSSGPAADDLFALAQDHLAVLDALGVARADVVGHAFGNRVARALATLAPDRIDRVVLLAGGGHTPLDPALSAALNGAMAVETRSDAERLADLRTAFFHEAHDPAVWLDGWRPDIAEQQLAANARTDPATWWSAGRAPVLLVQAEADPIAPAGNADALAAAIGDRLTLVGLRRASHAILPEQPRAVAALIASYLAGDTDAAVLQARTDRLIV